MSELRRILLAEDNANDVELTLTALRTNRVLSEVVVIRDGAETLDYLGHEVTMSSSDEPFPTQQWITPSGNWLRTTNSSTFRRSEAPVLHTTAHPRLRAPSVEALSYERR